MRNGTARLTQAGGRDSVIIRMPKAMQIRIARWPLRTLSLLAIVALLVAPSCPPLCASQNCRQADASATTNGKCHATGAMHHETRLAHSIRNCNSPELPAIVSASTPLSEASDASRLGAPGGIFLAIGQGNSTPAATLPEFWFCRPHDLSSGFTPVLSGVLRI